MPRRGAARGRTAPPIPGKFACRAGSRTPSECDVLNTVSIPVPYSCPVAVVPLPGRDIFGRGIYLQPDKQIIGLGWAWHEKIEPTRLTHLSSHPGRKSEMNEYYYYVLDANPWRCIRADDAPGVGNPSSR